MVEGAAAALVRGEERPDLGDEVGVARGSREPGPSLAGGAAERFVEEALDLPPPLRGQGPPEIALCSHARASAHSLLTVAGDTPSISAVSSMVRPAK